MNNCATSSNRFLRCMIDEEKKTVNTVLVFEGDMYKLMEAFHKFIHCLGADYTGYTIYADAKLSNKHNIQLYARIH